MINHHAATTLKGAMTARFEDTNTAADSQGTAPATIGSLVVSSSPTPLPAPERPQLHSVQTPDSASSNDGQVLPSKSSMALPRESSAAGKLWSKKYRNFLRVSDSLIIAIAVFGAQALRFGSDGPPRQLEELDVTLSYTGLSVIVTLGWIAMLAFMGGRARRIAGTGIPEYKRIFKASFMFFGLLAITDLVLKIDIARGYLFLAFPGGVIALVVSRWFARKWLYRRRREGKCLNRAVVVGDSRSARHVVAQISHGPAAGFKVVGIVTDAEIEDPFFKDISIAEDHSVNAIVSMAVDNGADSLILTTGDKLSPAERRKLGWAAKDHDIELIVAPALTDVAAPRIHTRPVSGMPLNHIEYPELTGVNYWMKRTFDIVGSGIFILLLSPLFLVVALIIKITSPGPIFYKQIRIGQDGQPFAMFKFRSMIVNADAQLKALLEAQGTADKPLFKVVDDPRITPIGKFIRRFSIDELPQLFNALLGTMSLVGPRPQVKGEVALYDDSAFRRLKVKPGLTGLWQVSGRSNLSWEESIRLDLYYVENWSLTGDIKILLRTVRAVIGSDGAY